MGKITVRRTGDWAPGKRTKEYREHFDAIFRKGEEAEALKIHLAKSLGGYCECECVGRDCSECIEEDVSTTHCHGGHGILLGPAR